MHLQVCRGEEKGGNTHLASPRQVFPIYTCLICLIGRKGERPIPFAIYFCYESVSNMFDRDRPSQLWDAVTLGRSSLYIRAATMEIAIYQ
jgi:hypothetical protein